MSNAVVIEKEIDAAEEMANVLYSVMLGAIKNSTMADVRPAIIPLQ